MCEDCKYFDPTIEDKGLCRVNPPRFRGEIYWDEDDNEKREAHWPVVYKDDWCGSFVKIES